MSIPCLHSLDEVEARADEAINSFDWAAGAIAKWDDFKDCLVKFLVHMEIGVFRLRSYPDRSPDFSWGRCIHVLLQEYGMNGEKAAFEMARTGAEGGLYAVLKAIAKRILDASQVFVFIVPTMRGLVWPPHLLGPSQTVPMSPTMVSRQILKMLNHPPVCH